DHSRGTMRVLKDNFRPERTNSRAKKKRPQLHQLISVKENEITGSGDRPNTNQHNSIMASINDHTISLVLKAEVKIMYIVVMPLQVFDHYLVDANLKIRDVGRSGLVRSIGVECAEVE